MKKKVDMDLVVSALPAYVNQESEEILTAANYGFKTGSIVSWQYGIKLTDALHYLETDPARQAGTCSLSSSGDATFTQKTITVANLAYKLEFCMQDLLPKWTQRRLPSGSNAEDEQFTFGEQITANVLEKIEIDNELTVWKGDTAGAGIYVHFDGFIKLIDAGSPVNGNPTGITAATGITVSNAFGIARGMADAVPVAVKTKSDLTLFMGTDFYDLYANNLMDLNLFHHVAEGNYDSKMPLKNVRVVGVPGLDGTDRAFLGSAMNFVIGSDMDNEYEQAKSWFDENTDLTYLQIKYKLGTQVKFIGEVVEFTLVP
jgi:hypothetical protein